MRTEEYEIETCDAPAIAQEEIDVESLWLDQDISGVELVELDPLDEIHDLLVLAHAGLRKWWGMPHLEFCAEEFLGKDTGGDPDD